LAKQAKLLFSAGNGSLGAGMSAIEPIKSEDLQSVAERRMRMPPIPDDFFGLITNEQRIALNQKQQFGWFVKFVRRPLFQPIEVVLSNPDGSEFLMLENDGVTRPFFNVRTDDLR
jgi:hypothetical protein